MIRATLVTKQGPVALLGINDDDILRLQAGMPLDIALKPMTPPGTRMIRVVIHHAHTYSQVVEDWDKGGIPVTDDMRKQAKDLDEQLEREKQ